MFWVVVVILGGGSPHHKSVKDYQDGSLRGSEGGGGWGTLPGQEGGSTQQGHNNKIIILVKADLWLWFKPDNLS